MKKSEDMEALREVLMNGTTTERMAADETGGDGVAGVGSWTLPCICGAVDFRLTPRFRAAAP